MRARNALLSWALSAMTAAPSREQGRRLGDVTNLPSRDNEAQRAAQRIGQHMDLGRQTTSRTPQRLIFGPPFQLAAC